MRQKMVAAIFDVLRREKAADGREVFVANQIVDALEVLLRERYKPRVQG